MVEPALRPARYEDLFDLPAHVVGEIVNGRLVTHPRPAPRHARAYSALGGNIGSAFDFGGGSPGGWWILDEPEIHIGGHVVVPDLAGWRRERMPGLPREAWFSLAPDWVCEILSPGTARFDRSEKMPLHASWGVAHAWLVDPDLELLEAYENTEGRWTLAGTYSESATVRSAPFDAVELDLAVLWSR